MARSNPVQPCIFCGEVPCECTPRTAKPKTPRKLRGKPIETVDLLDGSEKADPFASEEKVSRFKVDETVKPQLDEDELIFREAIRNLEPILSERDRRNYQHIINPPLPDGMERQIAEWRQRNGKVLQDDGEA